MTAPDRIPCLNQKCRRTCADDGATTKMVCAKCWRLLPLSLRDEWKRFKVNDRRLHRLAERRIAKGTISISVVNGIGERQMARHDDIWRRIEACFNAPETPLGLDNFLREVGL